MANEFKVKKGLIVDGSNTVVDIQGTVGQLFSVTDSLTGDLFSVSDVSGIPIFNVNSSGLSTFDGDVTINGGDITIVKQNDAPTMTLLHDGTNPSTNDLLFKMQFQSDYNGDHQNWGKIELDTNASSVRTNMDFYVKSTSGAEQLALRLEGQPSAVPNAIFEGDVLLSSSKGLYANLIQAVSNAGLKLGNDDNSQYIFVKDDTGVGIGTTSPGAKLNVFTGGNSIAAAAVLQHDTFTTDRKVGLGFELGNTQIKAAVGFISDASNPGTHGRGNLIFCVDSNDDAAPVSHSDEKLRISHTGLATFAGHVKIASAKYLEFSAMGKLINMEVPAWSSGNQEHNILYSGWTSSTGDYLSLKVAGNSGSGHGNLIIGDNGLWYGTMDTESTAQATDSATNPNGSTNRFRVDSSGNATFAGSITMPEALKATNNNIKFYAGGTHVFNVDVNKNIYPETHNDTDIGFSDTLAFRHAFFSGTGKFSNVNASSYQLNGTYIVDSSRNLVNINNITASQLSIDDYIYHNGDTNTYIYFTDDKQTFRTGGDDRFIIDNNGSTFSGHVKLFNTDEQIPNQNLLDIGSIKIAGRDDIYANATKTTYGDYVAKYVNDGTGGSTIRLYVDTNVLVDGDTYMVSVYYENLIGNLTLDWGDTNITGTNNVTGTSSSPKSGRLFGYASRATYGSTYRFLDINLSNGSGNEVTLHSPKVEAGRVVTDFVATERTDMTSNSKHLKDLKVTHSATFEQGIDINYGGSDRLSIGGDVDVQGTTDFAIPQGRKLKFDTSGGHTYISEESDSNLKVYVGGAERFNFSGGTNYSQQALTVAGHIMTSSAGYLIASRKFSAINSSGTMLTADDGSSGLLIADSGNATFTGDVNIDSSSTSGSTVLDVQGTVGQLFSVTNSLTGDLFSVSDVSGVPIFNVNSSGASTFDGNVSLTNGNLTIPEYIYHSGNTDAHIRFQNNRVGIFADFGTAGYIDLHDNGNVYIGASNSTALTITSSNATFSGGGTFQSAVTIDSDGATDNYYLNFSEAGSARFTIYENSNNVYFNGWAGHTIFRPQMAGSGSFAVLQGNTQFDLSGNATLAGGITAGGNIEIQKQYPVIILDDSNASTPTNAIAYISYQINGSEKAWTGWGSGSTNDFTINAGVGSDLILRSNNSAAISCDQNQATTILGNLYLGNVDTNTSSELTVLVLNGSTNEVEKRELGSLAFSGLADSASGNRWGVNAFVASDGVMEVGRYIDFHTSDGSTSDYAHRLTVTGSTLYFSGGISGSSATFSSTVNMNATARFNFSANSHGSQFEAASTALQTFRCDSDRFRIYMGSERLTVTDGGRVGINKPTPAYTLDVNGNVSNISIYASHDVAAYSDARVKTDIETIPNALDKVNKLRGVTFKRTDEGSTDKRMMGVIAQEVLDVVPEVVNQRDSDGHYSVSYGNMVGVLIEAVKELKAEVEELKKQIK